MTLNLQYLSPKYIKVGVEKKIKNEKATFV